MANKRFEHYAFLTGNPGFDIESSLGEFLILLVMEGWTFAAYQAATNLGALDLATYEFDGTGYVRKPLQNATWTKDAPSGKSYLDADDVAWGALGQGTGPAVGAILAWDDGLSGVDAQIVPVGWFDQGGFPKDGTGGPFTLTWDPRGLLAHG